VIIFYIETKSNITLTK